MIPVRWNPVLDRDTLEKIARPQDAGQNEALPWILFDTQLYTSATTVSSTFFGGQGATSPRLSNQTASGFVNGMFSSDRYFLVYGVNIDILTGVSRTNATAGTGVLNDISLLINTGSFQCTWDSKKYGDFPLRAAGALGGATGIDTGVGAANDVVQAANNGVPGATAFHVGGAWVIPPQTAINFTLDWSAAQTLGGGNPNIMVSLVGVMYRRVA